MVEAMFCYEGASTEAVARNVFRGIKEFSDDILCNRRRYGDLSFVTIVAERFFLRVRSTAGLTVTLCVADHRIDAYGAYAKLLNMAENMLMSLDFIRLS